MKARLMLFCGALLAAMVGVGSDSYAANIDGYKKIKFGITQQALKKQHPCSIIFDKPDAAGIITAYCTDFSFNGSETYATFHLIDGKLLRISILAGDSYTDFMSVGKGLVGKYGKADTGAPQSVNAYEEGQVNEIKLTWDPGVLLAMHRSSGGNQMVSVIYSDARYVDLYQAAKQKLMGKDL